MSASQPSTVAAPMARRAERSAGGEGIAWAPISLGAAPLFALVAAAGLMLVAFGNNAARDELTSAAPLFWGGLCLAYGPITYRLLSVRASRAERIALVMTLGLALYGVKILHSPVSFDLHDELGTWRQTSDLINHGRYLSFNPLVEGYAGYPTLASITAALAELCHLNIFHAALIVIGVARVTLMLALFLFIERVTGSARAAGVGAAVYACNPSFLYFDSQFGYESLALPIAAVLLLVTLMWTGEGTEGRRGTTGELLAALAVLSATLTVTHHMTSYAVLAFFLTWIAAALLDARAVRALTGRQPARARAGGLWERLRTPHAGPIVPALLLAAGTAAWFFFVARKVTVAELGGTLTGVIESTVGLIFGSHGPKTLFQSSGQTNSDAARGLALASIVPLLLAIPFGLRRVWQRLGEPPIWKVLAIVGSLFPITLGLRLTLEGTETSQRASEFVFLGLAFLVGIIVEGWTWPARRHRTVVVRKMALAAIATIVFLGGFVIGESPVTRQPGPFLVSAESRSFNAEGIAASEFSSRHLQPYSGMLTDRPNAWWQASYAHMNPLLGKIAGIPVTRVFFTNQFTPEDRTIIGDGHIRYLVVDGRQSSSLPVVGIYFERYEPHAFAHRTPLSTAALHKFHLDAGFNRIYSNGPIVIYDTTSLPPERHGLGER